MLKKFKDKKYVKRKALKQLRFLFRRRNEFHLFDSACYYLSALDRIGSPTYIPSLQVSLVLAIFIKN